MRLGEVGLGTHYGYGIAINESEALGDYYVHHGGINGFRSALIFIPKSTVSIVLLTNVEEPPNQKEDEIHYNILDFEKLLIDNLLRC